MKGSQTIVPILTLSIGVLTMLVAPAIADESMEARVVKVFDGDAILVVGKDQTEHEVKLEGIDAPELKQEFGSESAEALTRMLQDKTVRLTWANKDKFERPLAQVYLADKHINLEMLKNGMAWHFKRYNKSEELAKAEAMAKAAKKGLWAKDAPVAPWTYRQDSKSPDKPFKSNAK
ncbi:MAG: thermonuclease family protein [Pirellula sp.]